MPSFVAISLALVLSPVFPMPRLVIWSRVCWLSLSVTPICNGWLSGTLPVIGAFQALAGRSRCKGTRAIDFAVGEGLTSVVDPPLSQPASSRIIVTLHHRTSNIRFLLCLRLIPRCIEKLLSYFL